MCDEIDVGLMAAESGRTECPTANDNKFHKTQSDSIEMITWRIESNNNNKLCI